MLFGGAFHSATTKPSWEIDDDLQNLPTLSPTIIVGRESLPLLPHRVSISNKLYFIFLLDYLCIHTTSLQLYITWLCCSVSFLHGKNDVMFFLIVSVEMIYPYIHVSMRVAVSSQLWYTSTFRTMYHREWWWLCRTWNWCSGVIEMNVNVDLKCNKHNYWSKHSSCWKACQNANYSSF